VTISEVDSSKPLKKTILKLFSGGDTIVCRQLYQSQSNFRPEAQITLVCNELPQIHNMDSAMKSRMRVIYFDSVFKPAAEFDRIPPDQRTNIFLADPNIEDKIDVDALVQICIEANKTLEGRIVPQQVLVHTSDYCNDHNHVERFVQLFVVSDPNPEAFLSSITLFTKFEAYCKENAIDAVNTKPRTLMRTVSKLIRQDIEQVGTNEGFVGRRCAYQAFARF